MEDTIVAISTALGPGGIAIVRLSGEGALDLANQAFNKKGALLNKDNHRKMIYGQIKDGDQIVDEVLAVAFFAPNSYTREDMVEIHCHGGYMAVKETYGLMLKLGARPADPGEFTKRAFLNGRIDLAQAEAIGSLIDAYSKEGYQESLSQLEGSLSRRIHKDREALVDMMALIEANIDFPTDEVEEANNQQLLEAAEGLLASLKKLRATSKRGKFLRDGIRTTIVGKPNVGKSSLLNSLLQEERAIVTDIPGTTRDVIEEFVQLDGLTLRIKDTAGIRDTHDLVEKMGVDIARASIGEADLILALFDSSRPLDKEDKEVLSLIGSRPTILVLNKSDLEAKTGPEDLKDLAGDLPLVTTSLLREEGVEDLEEAIGKIFFKGDIKKRPDSLIMNLRHLQALDRAIEALGSAYGDLEEGVFLDCVEVDLKAAYLALGEITGESIEEEILDRIFSEFCIGK
ncbi:MAG: tRNA uridine-5-carboxymethylaminomethyl(34) synthesis GTPase MnmE [Tissierellia bacterium]|nr:tRNA uridine-5-carboxymethylaminomethyl(34) synthesis GTPase MnmE [Tissierellia bacterium]